MTTVTVSLREELRHDFSQARSDLARARLRHAKKDTPAERAAVADCLMRIDTVLDMYLESLCPHW
jgi:hypothetical protein